MHSRPALLSIRTGQVQLLLHRAPRSPRTWRHSHRTPARPSAHKAASTSSGNGGRLSPASRPEIMSMPACSTRIQARPPGVRGLAVPVPWLDSVVVTFNPLTSVEDGAVGDARPHSSSPSATRVAIAAARSSDMTSPVGASVRLARTAAPPTRPRTAVPSPAPDGRPQPRNP